MHVVRGQAGEELVGPRPVAEHELDVGSVRREGEGAAAEQHAAQEGASVTGGRRRPRPRPDGRLVEADDQVVAAAPVRGPRRGAVPRVGGMRSGDLDAEQGRELDGDARGGVVEGADAAHGAVRPQEPGQLGAPAAGSRRHDPGELALHLAGDEHRQAISWPWRPAG